MRLRGKLLLTALTAAFILASAIGSASANRLATSEQGFRTVFPELTFTSSEEGISVICRVTLEGSFHSATISKVSGQLIGYITQAAVNRPCSGGTAWALNGTEVLNGAVVPNSLPWHIQYASFSGTLPNITGINLRLIRASFLIEVLGVKCLYETTEANPARGTIVREAGGVITALRAEEGASIPRKAGQSIFCPSRGVFKGTSSQPTRQGGAGTISVTLTT
jgi:hypothetical protein